MRPAARVTIAGNDVSSVLFGANGPLISLTVTDEAGVKSDTFELELDDREGFKAPNPGDEIQVWLGYEPAPPHMGRYKVEEWEKSGPARTLRVSAKAAELTSAIRAAKVNSFDQKTLGEIVEQVASSHGLTAQVDSELASIAIDHIDQQHESDLGFLSRLAKRNGGTFKLADGKVLVAKKGSGKLPAGGDKPTVTLTPGMVTSWSATQGKRGEYKTVSASYMVHAEGKRKTVKAGSGEPKHRIRTLFGSEAEARAAAKAELGMYARGQMTVEITAPGLPTVFSEGKIVLDGFDPDVDGEFLIKTVRHTFSSSGYTTSISAETGGDTEAATG